MRNSRPTKISSSRYSPVVHILAIAGAALSPFDYVHCEVELLNDTRFSFELRDFYWNRLIASDYSYEPEIAFVLDLFKDIEYGFVDCGANYGFWSLIASSRAFGAQRVIAIEALSSTFKWLERNVELNERQITTLRAAVTEFPNERKIIYERGRHAGASLDVAWLGNDRPLSQTEEVETVSLDSLLANHPEFLQEPRIIKLDIEGAEIDALAGGRNAVTRDALIIYEEYGEERACKATKFVIDEFQLRIFFIDDRRQVRKITTLDEVKTIKRHRTRGYNLMAVSPGSVFDNRLSEIAQNGAR